MPRTWFFVDETDLFNSKDPDEVMIDKYLSRNFKIKINGSVVECYSMGRFVGKAKICFWEDETNIFVSTLDILKPQWKDKFQEAQEVYLWNLYYQDPKTGFWNCVFSTPVEDYLLITDNLRKEFWRAVSLAVKNTDWLWGNYGTTIDVYTYTHGKMMKYNSFFLEKCATVTKKMLSTS